ncbi:RNA polymerase sigma factor [Tuwongella immobilis]|uniref:HTH luxR-type domain-containing protein n=1 Tax=Tuwongella immobilis TaxID=692036 RepID=A0A6C2YMF5_9BACT|nr:RNA polymerase sigma factor [Tuwongella immobilis]VIP02616.1 rna sigma-24 ecf subfamily : RNA polymerase, sigma-24 subunit, ECF subfamily OS=Rhodopirellula maiorica SM1 GN=RMSM_06145 PE=4 SV=1: Sigma70_r2: Sigma70_r4_2 [Tuwongella immobilis]VTS01936.1 rna sigma-24 ecf subfamily : RNA polymerase, sigma-24 subunit, ECF subfamily OS=Rhodopirellula maiorica SM1 GN=RMSM_06145 PE=4 SV=1: Sigma70_r2: Sigma70_r4_2 [Tuwongella immobilis]
MNTLDVKPDGQPPSMGDGSIAMEQVLISTFAELRDELVSTLVFILGNREDAQDVAQDTFLKCWRNREALSQVLNLRAWIFRVGLNAARDHQRSAWNRRAKPFSGEESMLVGRDLAPGQLLEDQESLSRLREAIGQLRQEEQEVFLLRQNGGLTYEQIAEIRQSPVGTVKTQMRSALQKLRSVLN